MKREGKYAGLSFEQAFKLGADSTRKIHKPLARNSQKVTGNQVKAMTETQRKWFELTFPKNWNKQELICLLRQNGGQVLLDEVRHADFTTMDQYLSGPEGAELVAREGSLPVKGKWGNLRGYKGEGYYVFRWRFTNSNPIDACEICVDEGIPLRMLSPRETVEKITESVRRADARVLRQLNQDDKTIQDELTNSDDKVFLYELLQNANDYPLGGQGVRVEIKLDEGCLCFRHTGCRFTAANVNAICSVNEQDKSNNPNAIGYKGIGFKTVFRNNPRVYLNSGDFSFWFDRDRAEREVRLGAPWRRTPLWDAVRYTDMGEYRVGFKLYPENKELLSLNSENGYARILRSMFADERVLLFIPNLSSVEVKISSEEHWVVRKNGSDWCVSDLAPVELTPEIRQVIDELVEAKKIPPKMKGKCVTGVTFACRVDGRRLCAVDNACLYCFLPAEKEVWGFGFLMNTDMIPTGDRYEVRTDMSLNGDLSYIAGGEFFKWINELIKCGKYAYDSIFELIPNFEDCVNNARLPAKIKEFIGQFRDGFTANLGRLMVPDNEGKLTPVKDVWRDGIGIIEGLGYSFWQKFHGNGCSVHKDLARSQVFNEFLNRYATELGLKTFGWDKLQTVCETEELLKWLKNPNANNSFVLYLINNGVLGKFEDLPIFLDNRGDLARADELHLYDDTIKSVERWLPEFLDLTRFLSPKVSYQDKLDGAKFKEYGPRNFIASLMFGQSALEDSRDKLKDLELSKRFWSFVAHYRLQRGAQRFAGDYSLLSKLPFVDADGNVVESFESAEYSVYVKDGSADPELVDAKWYDPQWVKVINSAYFEGDDGEEIKAFFTDGKVFNNSNRLVHKFSFAGCYLPLAVQFKEKIPVRMRELKSDLGLYDYLGRCFAEDWTDKKKFAHRFADFPILDWRGNLLERNGDRLFFYDKNLVPWKDGGWVSENWPMMINEKYSTLESMFNGLGIEKYDDENFGYWFNKVFGACLTLDSVDKINSFHHYMQDRLSKLSLEQQRHLKSAPILVWSSCGPKMFDGDKQCVYFIEPTGQTLDYAEISRELPDDKHIVASELCDLAESYFIMLGCRVRSDEDVVKDKVARYLRQQEECVEPQTHYAFIEFAAAQKLDAEDLEGVKLYGTDGKTLYDPAELYLGSKYAPACDFQLYGIEKTYVSERYADLGIDKGFLLKLGVNEGFGESDVELLTQKEFCEYFWKSCYPTWDAETKDEAKKWFKKDLKCVLDRKGEVRSPGELYSPSVKKYVEGLSESDCKLPDGFMPDDLDYKKILSLKDCLDFLLTNPEYKMRGEVLKWVADSNDPSLPKLVEDYRNDERAVWLSGAKNHNDNIPAHIKSLCAIKGGSEKARMFRTNEHVLYFNAKALGFDGASNVLEKAITRLGIPLLGDDSFEEDFGAPTRDEGVNADIKARMLIYLAARDEEWEHLYEEKAKAIDDFVFARCSKIVVQCKMNDWLRSEHGKFSSRTKDGKEYLYYIESREGWQNKHVYVDIVATLYKKLFNPRGPVDPGVVDELKEALDTDGGDVALARKLVAEYESLVEDGAFAQKVKEVSPGLWQCVVVEKAASRSENAASPIMAQDDSGDADDAGAVDAESEQNYTEECAGDEPDGSQEQAQKTEQKHKAGKYEVDDDEYFQLSSLFEGGLTGENGNDQKKKWQDESKLACLRLFNYLKEQGLEPTMDGHQDADYIITTLYADIEDKDEELPTGHRGPNIDIKTGKRIHVVSARAGVAYLSPLWWNRVSALENNRFEVCAITGAKIEEMVFLRNLNDILARISDNALPVKVKGKDEQERHAIVSDWFAKININATAGKVYALLKVKASTNMDKAFEKGFCSDAMSKRERVDISDLWG